MPYARKSKTLKEVSNYSQPAYTEEAALAQQITLINGTNSTIGECSPEEFRAYITEQVKAFAAGEWQYFRDELFKDIDIWDGSTRWYILNELTAMRRGHRWADNQRVKQLAKYHAKKGVI